ncbi:MAG: class I SAM-dependent methyltransferase [Nitrososphaera sp.]|nr:class I SAM-dependent methyltransferase [Nitrososphaera sp.]
MLATAIRCKLKEALPRTVLEPLGKMLREWRRFINKRRKASEVFDDVYRKNIWGGSPGELCSGHGTVENLYAPYCSYVAELLEQTSVPKPRILDIGCGDFRVGRYLLSQLRRPVHHIGIDVALTVITHHQKETTKLNFPVSHSIEFICMDATEGELPVADLCLIRQVLQHLSNTQIKKILDNTSAIRTLVVTEEQRTDQRGLVPNKDKTHGPDTRFLDQSGVYLDLPPFSLNGVKEVLSTEVSRHSELKTFLLQRT